MTALAALFFNFTSTAKNYLGNLMHHENRFCRLFLEKSHLVLLSLYADVF